MQNKLIPGWPEGTKDALRREAKKLRQTDLRQAQIRRNKKEKSEVKEKQKKSMMNFLNFI